MTDVSPRDKQYRRYFHKSEGLSMEMSAALLDAI